MLNVFFPLGFKIRFSLYWRLGKQILTLRNYSHYNLGFAVTKKGSFLFLPSFGIFCWKGTVTQFEHRKTQKIASCINIHQPLLSSFRYLSLTPKLTFLSFFLSQKRLKFSNSFHSCFTTIVDNCIPKTFFDFSLGLQTFKNRLSISEV